MKKTIFVIGMTIGSLLLLGLGPFIVSAETSKEKEVLHPTRADVKPKIDGVLDEEIWQTPPLETSFTTYYPNIGAPAPYKTLVWISHDSKNLYFAFLCLDPEPQKIKTSVTEKDNMYHDDWVGISLDPLGTKQTAWALFVNPNGIQGDILVSAASVSEDRESSFVWKSAGKMTDKGYQVEIAVPLRNLNFKSGKEVKMGVLFWRNFSRYGLRACWPEYIPGGKVFSTQTPIIYKDIKSPLKLDLQPNFAYGSNQRRLNPEEWGDKDVFKNVGIDVKYGLTSSVTADISINPDFSQVESDDFQAEVNQRYPLFYSERRSFFKEVDIFHFFTVPRLSSSFFPNAVYTRRILNPAWGFKLTGALGKTAFGIFTAGDDGPGQSWEVGENPNEGKQAVWGIARGKYSLGKDNYIGILYSGRDFAGKYNRVFGGDAFFRLFNTHRFNVSFLHSISSGDNSNVPGLKSSNFNFLYDYSSKTMIMRTYFEHIGTNFRMDSAYLRRTGVNHGMALLWFYFHPKFKTFNWLKQIRTFIQYQFIHDLNTGADDFILKLSLDGKFSRSAQAGIRFRPMKESWMGQTFNLNQWYCYGHIQLTKWLRLHAEYMWGDNVYYEGDPPFKGKWNHLNTYLNFQPIEEINQHFSFVHAQLSKDNQKIYEENLFFSRTTIQFNKYLFLRAKIQYNSYQKKMLTDFLAMFTRIPGTVLYVGYGGLYENREWQENNLVYRQGELLNIKRGFFAKITYLWRFNNFTLWYPPHYRIHETSLPIKVDGVPDEKVWQDTLKFELKYEFHCQLPTANFAFLPCFFRHFFIKKKLLL